jgi:hypothetical protein
MHYLDLPPRVAFELEEAAEAIGATPEQLSILLLNIGVALWGGRVLSPFTVAVRTFLGEQAVDPARAATVLQALVGRCLQTAEADSLLSEWREQYSPVRYHIPHGYGVMMIKEQPIHAYQPAAPSPLARASARGRYAHLRHGSEEFARAKEAEIALEDRGRR